MNLDPRGSEFWVLILCFSANMGLQDLPAYAGTTPVLLHGSFQIPPLLGRRSAGFAGKECGVRFRGLRFTV